MDLKIPQLHYYYYFFFFNFFFQSQNNNFITKPQLKSYSIYNQPIYIIIIAFLCFVNSYAVSHAVADPAQGVAGVGGDAGHFLNELSGPLGLEAVCLVSINVAPHLNAK